VTDRLPVRLTLQIDDLAPGGEGVGRSDGRAVFVPYTAPGDRVVVEVRAEAGSGGALHDDIALVLVEYVPQEAGHEAEDQSRTSPALTTTTSSSIACPTVSSVISASDRFWKPAR